MAAWKAAIVFSGGWRCSPRWEMTLIFFPSSCGVHAVWARATPPARVEPIRSFRIELRIFLCPFIGGGCCCAGSESEATDEKQHARVLGTGDLTKRSVGDRRVEPGELRMVEGVVGVDTEGEGGMLPQGHLAHEAEVPHVLTRPVECSAGCVAEGVRGRDLKGRGV